MNNIAALSDKRQLTFDQNIERIKEVAILRFQTLACFDTDSFDAPVWQYQGSKIYFTDKSAKRPFETFVDSTTKTFVISHLWRTRFRANRLSITRLTDLTRVGRLLQQYSVTSANQITSTLYSEIISEITYEASGEKLLFNLNSYITFLSDEFALPTVIDLVKPKQARINSDEDFEPLTDRMPDPELIKGVIDLKRKIEEKADGSPRSNRDLMCIYTQAFQYGLGLRIGEVLRLSKDCLFEFEGKLMCRVWTEKGAEPIPRYVLADWRELISDVYGKILSLTETTRNYALELEKSGTNSYIEDALKRLNQDRNNLYCEYKKRLDDFVKQKRMEAEQSWTLKRPVNPSEEYALDSLTEILPISSTAKLTPDKVKAYRKWDLDLTITPIGVKKHSYKVSGQAILHLVDQQISLRSENITEQEFLSIVHGRPIKIQNGKNKEIFDLTRELSGSTATCYTFAPQDFAGKGRAPTAMSLEQAEEMLKKFSQSMLPDSEVQVSELRKYLPDMPFIYAERGGDVVKRNVHLDIHPARIGKATTDTKNSIGYSITTGFAITIDSIKRYAMSRFFERNQADINKLNDSEIEEQLALIKMSVDKGFDECSLPATIISSRSFVAEQHVSDYLFLCPMQFIASETLVSFIPEILDIYSLYYFFKGSDRTPCAFRRYGVAEDDRLARAWKSHQGRHWRTTSLFRSGASKSLVNKLMGRSDQQGQHYDHNTGSERAKIIGEAMKEVTGRFAGYLPSKIATLKAKGADSDIIDEVLEKEMQTINHTPTGYCTQSLELNPCQHHLRCLMGADGGGCKNLVIDLDDPAAMPKIKAIRDETRHEIERLVRVKDETGHIAIDKHLREKIKLYDNSETVISLANKLIDERTSSLELIPFRDGDHPDDCPFQCGGD